MKTPKGYINEKVDTVGISTINRGIGEKDSMENSGLVLREFARSVGLMGS